MGFNRSVLVFTFLLVAASPALPRDYPFPIAHADPITLATEGLAADTAYHDYRFLDGIYDLFSVRQRLSIAFLSFPPDSALSQPVVSAGIFYQSHLAVSPNSEDAAPEFIGGWFMNSVQFEYGLLLGVRPPVPIVFADPRLAFEYSRTSQHPLVRQSSGSIFSQVASDIVGLSLYTGPIALPSSPGRFRANVENSFQAAIRFHHVNLFDFWQSPLLRPRTKFRLELPVEAEWGMLVGRIYPRLLVLRQEGAWPGSDIDPGVQGEIDAEIGVRFGRGPLRRFELLLEFFTTQDTELLEDEPLALTTLGLLIRVGR